MDVRKEMVQLIKTITKREAKHPDFPQIKRVAAYARVSSGKDEMLHSLASQVSYFSDKIRSHPGWAFVGVYADTAVTGTKQARPDRKSVCRERV